MKKAWWLLVLLLVPVVNAYNIGDWPSFFVKDNKFSARYVVSDEAPSLDVVSATVISTSLAKFENLTIDVGTSMLDSEVGNITSINAIVVASPCDSSSAFELMGSPDPCYKDLGGSVGYVKLFQHGAKVQLLITGLNEKDRNAAAKFIAKTDLRGIALSEYVINSNSGSTPAFFDKKFLNKSVNKTPEPVVNVSALVPVATSSPMPVVKASPVPGAYEPLEAVPKVGKRGFWARLWGWISGLFT